jgi:hypothetical protein
MSPKPTISALATTFILAVSVASAAAQTGVTAPQIAQHELARAQARSCHDYRSQSSELNALATLSWQSGQLQKGLDYCNQALAIERAADISIREACPAAPPKTTNPATALKWMASGWSRNKRIRKLFSPLSRTSNDLSTSRLMSEFYDRWINRPAQGKAEALRQAQLALLQRPAAAPQAKNGRGVAVDSSAAPASTLGYAHPSYWPFVLIGKYE